MPVHRVLTALLAVVLLGCAAGVGAQAPATTPKPLDVPFVPTKEPIVDQMLKMAGVKTGDVVYDLGCGDGRIVITAAKRFGIRGVGIDLDPERISEANANALKAGVADRVKFIQGDLFDAKIDEATVVTLYLLPDVNLKLRPKLLSELKPGTRIVSHNYDMGDWKPEQTVKLTVDGTEHIVYAWTVPKRAARNQ
ncbi:MAG TPA: class I SAM-dependent methyltransferase [Methylomirabilota bacterium]|nr:class I SAM-dependent methyltransferase [Methylomirabilota bacterium]